MRSAAPYTCVLGATRHLPRASSGIGPALCRHDPRDGPDALTPLGPQPDCKKQNILQWKTISLIHVKFRGWDTGPKQSWNILRSNGHGAHGRAQRAGHQYDIQPERGAQRLDAVAIPFAKSAARRIVFDS